MFGLIQVEEGSRKGYARMDEGDDYNHRLSGREAIFIAARDSFYMASVGETGWPYVQHRGGPAGFMKVLDERTIGFADYSGNRQYVSTGNFRSDNRVALFFMDYPNRTRLKMLGRVRTVGLDEPELLARLEDDRLPGTNRARLCYRGGRLRLELPPAHYPALYRGGGRGSTGSAAHGKPAPQRPACEFRKHAAGDRKTEATDEPETLGEGPLELVVSGVRQLAPRVRAFELRDPKGGELPRWSRARTCGFPCVCPREK